MKAKKILSFISAFLIIAVNSAYSVSALSFPDLQAPELEYTPLEIPEDMPSPYDSFDEKRESKMQELIDKGYGQTYELGGLSMPSGFGQTGMDVYNKIGDKSFGSNWQEWGSQISVPEYSSLAEKHNTLRAQGQANIAAIPSAEQQMNKAKYNILSSNPLAASTYDNAIAYVAQGETVKIDQQINGLLSEQAAILNDLAQNPTVDTEAKKAQYEKLGQQIDALSIEKENIIAKYATGAGTSYKGSEYFLTITNPDGTSALVNEDGTINADGYSKLYSTYGLKTVSANPLESAEAWEAMKSNEEVIRSIPENIANLAKTAANEELRTNALSTFQPRAVDGMAAFDNYSSKHSQYFTFNEDTHEVQDTRIQLVMDKIEQGTATVEEIAEAKARAETYIKDISGYVDVMGSYAGTSEELDVYTDATRHSLALEADIEQMEQAIANIELEEARTK